MTVKSLVLFCLIFLVTNAEVLKAGASVCNSRPFYSSKIQSRDFHANDTTSNRIENDRIRPWTISVPVWIPGYKGQFTVGGVEVGGEPDGDFWDRLFTSELRLDFYFVGLVN